jgi:hypothetical protein
VTKEIKNKKWFGNPWNKTLNRNLKYFELYGSENTVYQSVNVYVTKNFTKQKYIKPIPLII